MLQAAVLRKSERQVGSVEAVKKEGEEGGGGEEGDRGKGSALGEGGGEEKKCHRELWGLQRGR